MIDPSDGPHYCDAVAELVDPAIAAWGYVNNLRVSDGAPPTDWATLRMRLYRNQLDAWFQPGHPCLLESVPFWRQRLLEGAPGAIAAVNEDVWYYRGFTVPFLHVLGFLADWDGWSFDPTANLQNAANRTAELADQVALFELWTSRYRAAMAATG